MAWAKNGTPDTLGSAGDTMTISDLTAKNFNEFLSHPFTDGSAIDCDFRIDNLSTSTYAYRYSSNGAADSTATSQAEITPSIQTTAADRFVVGYGLNISTEEKLFIFFSIDRNTAGAGTAPQRQETVGKQSGTSTAYTRIDMLNTQAGNFDTTSNLSALGTD